MASGNPSPPIYVQRYYHDTDYRRFVWELFCFLYARAGVGRGPFFTRIMADVIEPNIPRIRIDGDPAFRFDFPQGDTDFRFITDYLKDGARRRFADEFMRMFDAYVQLADPVIARMFRARENVRVMGIGVGAFLADTTIESRYELAVHTQRIAHFFEYSNIDNIGSTDETSRFLCLFRGPEPEYLYALDLLWRHPGVIRSPTTDFVSITDSAFPVRAGRRS